MDSLDYILDSIFNMLDTSDYVILTLFSAVATYFFFKCRSSPSSKTTSSQISSSFSSTAPGRQGPTDRSFLGRMKAEDRQVLSSDTSYLRRESLEHS